MKQLSTATRVQVISALVAGNSVNRTVRMIGVSKATILKRS
jgi:Trp operon repressor